MEQYTSKCGLYSMHSDTRLIENTLVTHKLHNHNQYEFFYLRKGEIEYNIECEKYSLHSGDVIMVAYHEYHTLNIKDPDVYDRIVIQMDEFFLAQMMFDLDIFSFLRNKPLGQHNKIPAEIVQKEQIDNLFIKLSTLTNRTPENDLLIKCTMIELLIRLKSAYEYSDINNFSQRKVSNNVQNILQFIHNNLEKDLSLDIIAKKFFLTKYYICHEFKKHTGIPINEYIVTKRILLANSYIKHGMPATEACYKTGFNNYPSFYRSFQRILNQSPTNTTVKDKTKTVIN